MDSLPGWWRENITKAGRGHMTQWQRWISQPQSVLLRKAVFQVHMWSGIGFGLYLLVVSVTGSIVVYSNELYVAATRPPLLVTPSGSRLSDDELKAAALRAYPGYSIITIGTGQTPNHAVGISLRGRGGRKDRFFNPYTGADLGNSVPPGIRIVSK